MLSKFEILIVIFVLLVIFYVVIALGAKRKDKSVEIPEISRYLFGVRILISIIAIVSLILWLFL